MKRNIFLLFGFLLSQIVFANETLLNIDCLGLKLEKAGDMILAEMGGKAYILGGENGAADGELAQLLLDIDQAKAGQSKAAELLKPENFQKLLDTLDQLKEVSGKPLFSQAEAQEAQGAVLEIRRLQATQEETLGKKAREIKKAGGNISLEQGRKEARQAIAADSSYLWQELQLRRKKEELLNRYGAKLSDLGIDIHASPAKFEESVKSVERSSKPPGQAMADIVNGKRFNAFFRKSTLQAKFEKHAAEFSPPIKMASDFAQKATALAQSEEPGIVSFLGYDEVTLEKRRWYKFNPKTNELIILTEDGNTIISYYLISPENLKKYRSGAKSPMDYFLSKRRMMK